MTGAGATEPVHRLRVVADDGQADPVRAQRGDDVDLDLVHVLVLIDQHVIPAGSQPRPDHRIGQQLPPGQQKVVEVEQPAGPLAGHERLQHGNDLVGAPRPDREVGGQHRPHRAGVVHGPRVDVGQDLPAGQPRTGTGEAVLVTDQVEQIDHVTRIEHRHRGQSQLLGVLSDHPVRHRMERAAPHPARRGPVRAQRRGPRGHVRRRPPGEGQEQDLLRRRAAFDQTGHSTGQHLRLARASAREHDQRLRAVNHRGALCVVQPVRPFITEHVFDVRP